MPCHAMPHCATPHHAMPRRAGSFPGAGDPNLALLRVPSSAHLTFSSPPPLGAFFFSCPLASEFPRGGISTRTAPQPSGPW